MNIEEEEQMKIPNSSKKHYIPCSYISKDKFTFSHKIAFIFIFLIILFFIVEYNINNGNKKLKSILSRKSIENDYNGKTFSYKLKKILDKEEIYENEMMNKHTTFELGGPAKFFVKPNSINKIIQILKLCKEYFVQFFILGNGSNLLVSDQGYDGLVININEENFSDMKIEKIDENNYKVTTGGGILMRTLAKRLCLLSLSGLEDIIDIPGTIGGGIIMNASAGLNKGLIYNSLDKVKVITPNGEIKELSKKDCKLIKRGSMLKDNKYIVIEATFNLKKENKIIIQKTMADHTSKRYSKQPKYFPSAGCFFVWNRTKYGSLYKKYKENKLISYRIGDAMIYTYNIAFIVNLGNAKASEVYKIVTHVENVIKNKYNITIRREVILLGYFP